MRRGGGFLLPLIFSAKTGERGRDRIASRCVMSGLPLLRPFPPVCEGRRRPQQRLDSSSPRCRRRQRNFVALAGVTCRKSSEECFPRLVFGVRTRGPRFRVAHSSARSVVRRDTSEAIGRGGGLVHGSIFGSRIDSSSARPVLGGDSMLCRVQSIEGTEKSSAEDSSLEQQKDRQVEKGDAGEAWNDRPQDKVTDGNREGTMEEKRRATTGRRAENGNPSLASRDESFPAGTVERTAETTPTEELQDYGPGEDWDEEVQYVTRISVPRQKYIPVPKVDLVNTLLLFFFPGNKDASKFLSICSSLEIILHTKQKVQLEELRSDYSLIHSTHTGNTPESSNYLRVKGATNTSKLGHASAERAEKHGTVGELADWPIDSPAMEGSMSKERRLRPLKRLADFRAKIRTAFKPQRSEDEQSADAFEDDDSPGPSSDAEASEAAAERFQKNFLRLLSRAEFEGISVRDLELTAALNPDYLLALPVDVDWKRTSASNVKIFRRGFTKEEQKGLLLGAKLDYLQSLIVRQMFKGLAGPFQNAGRRCLQAWRSFWGKQDSRELAESVRRWLQEPLQLEKEEEPLNSITDESAGEEKVVHDREAQLDMPIWLAARQAIPRYEAVLSSAGSRGKLLRRVLLRMGLVQSDPPPLTLPADVDEQNLEPHLRPTHLSRVSMKDIWQPASKAVVGRNVFRKISAAFSLFFSQATLQEPAFKELVLIYNGNSEGNSERKGLQLQTYKRIPLPDLKIVFPTKKLIYRVLDTLRLDITSVAGLLAFMVNYRFDDILSSPSAFALDVIAASALVVFLTRVVFGYKQVWDRYQLLVNKTLYEKTLAGGFGVVQFLLDATEEQQFKEAILVYLVLVHQGNKTNGMTKSELADACERFLYYRCKEQVEMPVDNALKTLEDFGLLAGGARWEKSSTDTSHGSSADARLQAVSYDEGLRALEQHWASQLSAMSLWN